MGVVTDRSWLRVSELDTRTMKYTTGENYKEIVETVIDYPDCSKRIYSNEIPMSKWKVVRGGMKTFYVKDIYSIDKD